MRVSVPQTIRISRNAKISWFKSQNTSTTSPKLIPYENTIKNSQNLQFWNGWTWNPSVLVPSPQNVILKWVYSNRWFPCAIVSKLQFLRVFDRIFMRCQFGVPSLNYSVYESRDFIVPVSDLCAQLFWSLPWKHEERRSPLQTSEWEKVHFAENLVVTTLGGFSQPTTALGDQHKNVTEIWN